MRVLALSDDVVSYVFSPVVAERHKDADLIVGCGDLPQAYLEYVVTMLPAPLVYVPGNHDPDDYHVPGGLNIDGKVVNVNGCMVMGLGGSQRYKDKGKHQYTEFEMLMRVVQLVPRLLFNRIRCGRALDIFVAHAPAWGFHDAEDLTHTGFHSFLRLIRWFKPRVMLHGHTHLMRNIDVTESEYAGCRIINVFPARMVLVPGVTWSCA